MNPEKLALKFTKERIFGIGSTVREFISNIKAGKSWYESGPHLRWQWLSDADITHPDSLFAERRVGITRDTALCAMMPHNNDLAISAFLLHNYLLWQLLDMNTNPDPEWWIFSGTSSALPNPIVEDE